MMDPPEHDRLRALVSRVFTPRAVGGARADGPRGDQRLPRPIADRDSFDAVAEFSAPFPVEIISRMLGVPAGERQQIREWLDLIAAPRARAGRAHRRGRHGDDRERRVLHGAHRREAAEPGRRHAQPPHAGHRRPRRRRRDRPRRRGDRRVRRPPRRGRSRDGDEAGRQRRGPLRREPRPVAGRHRGSRRCIPGAVEEILRILPPSQYQGRFSVEDREFEGGTIPAGFPVLLLTGAATRDPRQFEDPDRFDIRRPRRWPSASVTASTAASARPSPAWRAGSPSRSWRSAGSGSRSTRAGLRRVHMSNVAGYKNVPVTAVR